MAVRVDAEAFRESLAPAVAQIAERVREDGRLGELESAGPTGVRWFMVAFRVAVGSPTAEQTGRNQLAVQLFQAAQAPR